MTLRTVQYSMFLMLPVLVALVVSLMINAFYPAALSIFWPFFLAFSALIHIAGGVFAFPQKSEDAEKNKQSLMIQLVVTVGRLLIHMVLFLVYVLLIKENPMLGAIYFVSLYFLFLLADVISRTILFKQDRKM